MCFPDTTWYLNVVNKIMLTTKANLVLCILYNNVTVRRAQKASLLCSTVDVFVFLFQIFECILHFFYPLTFLDKLFLHTGRHLFNCFFLVIVPVL